MRKQSKMHHFSQLWQVWVVIALVVYSFAQVYAQPELIPYRKGDKWGFCDKNKKIIIPCEYDYVSPFGEQQLCRVQKKEQFYLMDKTGKILPNTRYGYIMPEREGMYVVSEKGLDSEGIPMGQQGYINAQGKLVVPMEYDFAFQFSDGLAKVRKNGLVGYIDKTSKLVIPFKYYDGADFIQGFTWVRAEQGYYIINKQGKEILLPETEEIYAFSEGMFIVRKGDKYGAVDVTGKIVIPIKYSYLSCFSEGLAAAQENFGEKFGFIDKQGKISIPFSYNHARNFEAGIAYVETENERGFIDKSGKFVFHIPNDAALKEQSNDGLLWIEYDSGKYLLMNNQGKILFKKTTSYVYVYPFRNGLSRVSKDGNISFYIDTNGTEYYEP